jgi:hypothetical protein
MVENPIREEIESKNTLFNRLFTKYQTNLRKDPNYIKFEAFKDMKIIFELYAKIYSFRSYSYNEVSIKTFSKLTSSFNCHKKKELYEYLAIKLIQEGNDEKIDEIQNHIRNLEISCLWDNIKKKKSTIYNSLSLILKLSAYNLRTLLLTCVIYVLITSVIYLPAPYSWMQALEIKFTPFSGNNFFNRILNTLAHMFNLDNKMKVIPTNWQGVLLLVLGKAFSILVIINYVVKKILNKIKFS